MKYITGKAGMGSREAPAMAASPEEHMNHWTSKVNPTGAETSSPFGRPPRSGPTSRFSVDAALAETITTLRELERVAFRFSRNSPAGLFFAQQRLLLMRLDLGKAPSRSDWLALAALGQKVATKREDKVA